MTSSAGHHALSNCAPIALFANGYFDLRPTVLEVAALTHGNGEAQRAAACGTALLAQALQADSIQQLDPTRCLQYNGAAGTAQHALHQAIIVTLEFSIPTRFLDALAAADRNGGRGAAAFAGALIGACYGISRLPSDLVGRLELGIIADTLARDTVQQQTAPPVVADYSLTDNYWWNRYPGW